MTTLVVTAAVIERDDRFLLTRRQPGVHLQGYWEFPGGKCEPGETRSACLLRELREELAVNAIIGGQLLTTTHEYPDRVVEIHFFRCDLQGVPSPQQGQELQWVRRSDLTTLALPPADAELIALLLDGRPG
jgi:mutator protein MutT